MDFNFPLPQLTGRVLFVDDEPLVLQMGKQMLTELGCHVTACQKSSEALEVFQNAPGDFDLVLSDLCMPILTGMELAVQLHAIRADIKILFLSGYIDEADLGKAQAVGVQEILAKPIRLQELASALGRYLPKSKNI